MLFEEEVLPLCLANMMLAANASQNSDRSIQDQLV